ncbi:ABC transporter ATP-binding protein [Nitriliruptoria bacterium AS10]|nr:ABC transporter ATP-binding protein [Salsipaludibacter albus]
MPSTQEALPDGPVVVADDVTLAFAGVVAVKGVSYEVAPRELFAIVGPNGAGKTSNFNLVSGVYQPTSGSMHVLGHDVTTMKPHEIARTGVARTFQNIELFENLTVVDNLMLGRQQHLHYGAGAAMLRTRRVQQAEVANREVVEAIVDFLDIQSHRDALVGMLPYGVQKRVELGRALAMEPKLLLLDEPVAGMNLEETEDMARFILDIRDELGVTIIMVEHDMGLVMDLADRVLVLDFGEVIANDVPSVVQRDPAVIRAYLGGTDMAELEGTR